MDELMMTLMEHYQVNQEKEKQYTPGQRIPIGAIIRTKDDNYYLVGNVASGPCGGAKYWVSGGCGGCSGIEVSPSDIAGYVEVFEIRAG